MCRHQKVFVIVECYGIEEKIIRIFINKADAEAYADFKNKAFTTYNYDVREYELF